MRRGATVAGVSPFPIRMPGVRFPLGEPFALHENAPALRFWRAVLPEHAGASLRETSTDDGVLFSFST